MMRVRDHWHAVGIRAGRCQPERAACQPECQRPGSATTGTEKATEAGISRTLGRVRRTAGLGKLGP